MDMQVLEKTLYGRALSCRAVVWPLLKRLQLVYDVGSRFYIGGGALGNGERHDIDVFLEHVPTEAGIRGACHESEFVFLRSTPNAVTIWYPLIQEVIQLCNYWKSTAEEMAKSFDYAHIQAVAEFEFCGDEVPDLTELHYTEAWIEANALSATWYVGSEFPLASLARMSKYAKYGVKVHARYSVVRVLLDLLRLAPYTHEQWLAQLNAIDILFLGDGDQDSELSLMAMELESLLSLTQTVDTDWMELEDIV